MLLNLSSQERYKHVLKKTSPSLRNEATTPSESNTYVKRRLPKFKRSSPHFSLRYAEVDQVGVS